MKSGIEHEMKYAFLDLFCGAGGTSTGIENIPNAFVFGCVNHDKNAILSHQSNHPGALHFTEDIRTISIKKILDKVNEVRKQYPGIKLCLWASLECFVEGTLILTSKGNIPIEQIKIGDYVLTHKNRWKKVTATMCKLSKTVKIKGQGFGEIETTPEHPFYTNHFKRIWNNPRRAWERILQNPEWTPISEASKNNTLLSTPRSFGTTTPVEVKGRGFEFSEDFWWVVGRWLGDGSVSNWGENKQITICCGKHEHKKLEERLNRFIPINKRAGKSEIRFYKREVRTGYLFDAFHSGLAEWLETYFGKYSYGKKIPGWALGMKKEWRDALLTGYVSADGSFDGRKYQCTSVSKELALGMKMLAQSLGYMVNFHEVPARNNPIEGRVVTCLPQFLITWLKTPKQTEFLADKNHIWGKLRKYTETNEIKKVYNISVEEDESYIANGIVVHNCTNHSNAKGGMSREADSRTLAEHLFRYFILDFDFIFIENVREFKEWGPLIHKHIDSIPQYEKNRDKPTMIPDKKFKGKDYKKWVKNVCKVGYSYEDTIINCADIGCPTTRKRLFIQFAKSGCKIAWPEMTHAKNGAGGLKEWLPVGPLLELDEHGESIFTRSKSLAPNTYKRVFKGVKKFGVKPFISKYYGNGDNVSDIEAPCPTLTTKDRCYLTNTFLMSEYSTGRNSEITSPAPTLTTIPKEKIVTTHFLIDHQFSNEGSSITQPCPTLIARQDKKPKYLVSAQFLMSVKLDSCGYDYLATIDGLNRSVIQNGDCDEIIQLKMFMQENGICDIKMRPLQVSEMLKIMTFPKGYILKGTKTEQKKYIGNAVPPLAAQKIVEKSIMVNY